MENKYVSFISDEHLINCIANLYKAYSKAKSNVTKKSFYSNKVDTIKLTFDAEFNRINEESLIQAEVLRQIDKSINNSIGTFHEQILGGIKGFEIGNLSGFDIKAVDNTLFAIIHHENIDSKLIPLLFEKLAHYANYSKKTKCYWVQFASETSFNSLFYGNSGELHFSHKRVYKISGDQFYALLTGQEDALYQLYKTLPIAIKDFLDSTQQMSNYVENTIFCEIKEAAKASRRSILDQISYENYTNYFGLSPS